MNTSRTTSGLPLFLAYTCLALSLLLQAQTCHATETENKNPPLEFVAEELPPLTFHSSGGADGLGADMVRELLRRNNLTAPLTVLPWARAYMMAQNQANIGVYCLARTEDRKNLFQWIGPLANIESKIYVTQSSPLHITSLEDARKFSAIIVLRESYNAQMLQKMKFKNVVMANNPIEAIRILRLRGDDSALLMESNGLRSTASKLALPPEAIKPLLQITKTQVYIGFSLDTSPALVSRLQHSLNEMKSDGSFAAIYKKWLPGDKPPGIEPEPDIFPAN